MATQVGIQLLGSLLECPSQCHFSANNSVLCLYKNHLLGERPSESIHNCIPLVFVILSWTLAWWALALERNGSIVVLRDLSIVECKVFQQFGWNIICWVLAQYKRATKSQEDSMGGEFHIWLAAFSQRSRRGRESSRRDRRRGSTRTDESV